MRFPECPPINNPLALSCRLYDSHFREASSNIYEEQFVSERSEREFRIRFPECSPISNRLALSCRLYDSHFREANSKVVPRSALGNGRARI